MSQSAKSHTISLLVNNKPGALIRVAQVFTRRSFNINSINVSPSLDKRYSHMTITSRGAIDTVRQMVLQLEKLVDVMHAIEHTSDQSTERELVLIKVSNESEQQLNSLKNLGPDTTVIEELDNHAIIQLVGSTTDLSKNIEEIKTTHKVVEILRSGAIAITHAGIVET